MNWLSVFTSIYLMIAILIHLVNYIAKRGMMSGKYTLHCLLYETIGAFVWPLTLYWLLKKHKLWPED